MTVPPLQGPHIQATGYRAGRARAHTPNPPVWLALHTTEGIADEIALGEFWQGRQASSNAGIGRDGGYASYVRYRDTPWTNPPVHDDTETLEICGMAGWTKAQWLSYPKMLETIAHWIAWRSEARGIPIVRREGSAVRNFQPGVVDHDGINDVFHESSHWDVGENFPWDKVLARAKAIRYGSTEPTPEPEPPEEEDPMYAISKFGTSGRRLFADQVYPISDGTFRLLEAGGVPVKQLSNDAIKALEIIINGAEAADDAAVAELDAKLEQLLPEQPPTG